MATYRHDWDVGESSGTVSAGRAMTLLRSRPNDVFPFLVKGRNGENDIRPGSIYDLINTTGPFDNMWTGPDPVQVTLLEDLKFTFTTLEGHHRGADQTISFELYEAFPPGDSGQSKRLRVYLAQYGTYVCSWSSPFTTVMNLGFNTGATVAWAIQAHNLRVALGTLGSCETKLITRKHNVFGL